MALSLFRIILRAFNLGHRPPRRSVFRPERTTVAERLASKTAQKRWSGPDIVIVDVVEMRGRCWVIDGDTIAMNGKRIRLAGIDAPELDHPYGQVAKGALIRLCRGQTIRAVTEGDMSYERLVATCYLPDGRDLSAELVRAGLAIDWRKFSGGKYRSLEPEGIRTRLWRCDARQKGLLAPASLPD